MADQIEVEGDLVAVSPDRSTSVLHGDAQVARYEEQADDSGDDSLACHCDIILNQAGLINLATHNSQVKVLVLKF